MVGLFAQDRNDSVCHRDWATVSSFNLSKEVQSSGSRNVTSRLVIAPRGGMHTLGNRIVHQVMVSRMERHFIDTVARAVMRMQNRLASIGVETPLYHVCTSSKCPNCA